MVKKIIIVNKVYFLTDTAFSILFDYIVNP